MVRISGQSIFFMQKFGKLSLLSLLTLERCHSEVVRAAWLWCRKSPEGIEVKAGLSHPMTGKLCQPSSKCVPFSNQGRMRQ